MLHFSVVHLRITYVMNKETAERYLRSALDDGDLLEAEAIGQAIIFNTPGSEL